MNYTIREQAALDLRYIKRTMAAIKAAEAAEADGIAAVSANTDLSEKAKNDRTAALHRKLDELVRSYAPGMTEHANRLVKAVTDMSLDFDPFNADFLHACTLIRNVGASMKPDLSLPIIQKFSTRPAYLRQLGTIMKGYNIASASVAQDKAREMSVSYSLSHDIEQACGALDPDPKLAQMMGVNAIRPACETGIFNHLLKLAAMMGVVDKNPVAERIRSFAQDPTITPGQAESALSYLKSFTDELEADNETTMDSAARLLGKQFTY